MFPWKSPTEPLRCDQFMAAALHDPERGYYARRIRQLGTGGDFTTTPGISGALGKAVAHWAVDAMRASGCRDLIELGPGEGLLAEAVLDALPWFRRRRVRLHLVETSQPLAARQRERLGRRVQWHTSVESALKACRGAACLYSNEFVDAFPARRFRRSDDGWEELHLLPGCERWQPADSLPASTQFDRVWPTGQHLEVHESYQRWLRKMLPAWQRGRMLTIDYGGRVDDLHHRRPHGSLRGYFHHQPIAGAALWERPGFQDLTADVCFTDLEAWSAPELQSVALVPQSEFLEPFADPSLPGDQFSINPAGSGGAFLYLDQRRQ